MVHMYIQCCKYSYWEDQKVLVRRPNLWFYLLPRWVVAETSYIPQPL